MVIFIIWGIIIYTYVRGVKDCIEHEKSIRKRRK